MNNYEEIKNLLNASRNLLGGSQMIEEQKSIKKRYGLITEQGGDDTETIDAPDNTIDRSNPMKDIESKIKYDTAEDGEEGEEVDEMKSDKKKGYRISGGIFYIHGKDNKDLQLTTDDKIAFQESMDEFVSEVAEIVDFNKLNLYPNNVEWSGKITEYDIEFFFSIGESNGVYINGTMMKVDAEFLTMMNKLQTYYEKFKSKWSKVIASRKKTKE
jgi:hypothetical protein